MFKQKNYLALGAVILVALLLLSLPTRVTSRLKLAVGSWFLPLFGLAGATQQIPADLADSVLPRRELLKQIDHLRTENQQLKSQAVQTAAVKIVLEQVPTFTPNSEPAATPEPSGELYPTSADPL